MLGVGSVYLASHLTWRGLGALRDRVTQTVFAALKPFDLTYLFLLDGESQPCLQVTKIDCLVDWFEIQIHHFRSVLEVSLRLVLAVFVYLNLAVSEHLFKLIYTQCLKYSIVCG